MIADSEGFHVTGRESLPRHHCATVNAFDEPLVAFWADTEKSAIVPRPSIVLAMQSWQR
jgi:hypothetical protein